MAGYSRPFTKGKEDLSKKYPEHESWLDAAGNKIIKGDVILYADKRGYMQYAEIIKINKFGGDGQELMTRGAYNYTTKTSAPSVPAARLTVRPLMASELDYYGRKYKPRARSIDQPELRTFLLKRGMSPGRPDIEERIGLSEEEVAARVAEIVAKYGASDEED